VNFDEQKNIFLDMLREEARFKAFEFEKKVEVDVLNFKLEQELRMIPVKNIRFIGTNISVTSTSGCVL
jgi:hypothetical protein